MAVNSEGIYSTRPWKIFGEGPTAPAPVQGQPGPGAPDPSRGQRFGERNRKDLTAEDVRFTTKGNTLYAFVMGWPEKEAVIRPLGTKSDIGVGKIKNVELLGFKGKLKWAQEEAALRVQMPPEKPCDYAITLRLAGV